MSRLIALTAFLVSTGIAGESHATFRFCPQWGYTFNDQNLGEDYLKHNVAATWGAIPAARTYAAVQQNGTTIWEGLLDGQGCSPALPSTTTAMYKVLLTGAAIGKPVDMGNAFFRVWDKESRQVRIFTWEAQLQATSAAQRHIMTLGIGDHIAAVAAVVVLTLDVPDVVVKPMDTPIYADDGCGSAGSCGDASGIYLGTSANGIKDAFTKTVVLHEIGHAIQDVLFGLFHGDYHAVTSSHAACRCDHVQPAGFRSHCLQSQETVAAAINEGWAQFIALDVLNRPEEANASFAYYKHFLLPGFGVFSPPVPIQANTGYKWNLNQCAGNWSTTGTELDWMTFFWELNNKGDWHYTYHDFRSVFINLCIGQCDHNDVPTLGGMAWIVALLYGSSSPKATLFAQVASKHLSP